MNMVNSETPVTNVGAGTDEALGPIRSMDWNTRFNNNYMQIQGQPCDRKEEIVHSVEAIARDIQMILYFN